MWMWPHFTDTGYDKRVLGTFRVMYTIHITQHCMSHEVFEKNAV